MTKLIVLNGKQAGQTVTLALQGENVLGREEPCALVLNDPACSRHHAKIWRVDNEWFIEDQSSANGTFLNGEALERSMLSDGDKLLLGSTWIRFLSVAEKKAYAPDAPATWVLEDSINPELSLSSISDSQTALTKRRELDCLEQVSRTIAHQTDPKVLVEEVLSIITRHLQAAGAKLIWQENQAVFAEHTRTVLPTVSRQTIEQALLTAEAVLVPNVGGQQRTRSIFAPLRYLEHVEGIIWVAEDAQSSSFKHEDLCLVASIAHVLAPPLKMLLDVQQLQRKNESLIEDTSVQVVGRSAGMQRVLQMVFQVADVDQTVLLRGESGVGKEVIARLIHEVGTRREQPMVCVNCAALTESLLESELFGYERGAFTGATETRAGKFETADGGTLFLDELGSMSLATQSKLLRVLDGHPFERVGGHTPIQVNVRVLAATNSNLETMVREGRFRADLYHRLRVIEIQIPPLRERRDDIAELAEYFLHRISQQTSRRMAFESGAIDVLTRHKWPGNVRQLRNTIERAAILNSGATITVESLSSLSALDVGGDQIVPMMDLTRAGIERALTRSANVPEAARSLGMSRSALYRHMKKLNIAPPRARAH